MPPGEKSPYGATGGPNGQPLEQRPAKTNRKPPRQHLWTYIRPRSQEVVGWSEGGIWGVLPLKYDPGFGVQVSPTELRFGLDSTVILCVGMLADSTERDCP